MMDKNPYKRLQEMLATKPVPKVDVKNKVMAAIYAKKNEEEKVVKKKIGLLLIVGSLVGASSVWAGMELIQLKNEKGEVVFELSQQTDYEQEQLIQQLPPEVKAKMAQEKTESERQDEIVTEIWNGLKPGKTAAIYWLPKEEEEKNKNDGASRKYDPNIDVVYKPFTYTNAKDIESKVGKMYTFPAELSGAFRFQEGEVWYEESDQYDVEAMKAEAKKDKKQYVVKEIPSSDKLERVSVAYKSEKGNVRVDVSIAKNGKVETNAKTMEKVMIGNNEAVLMTHTSKQGENSYWIIWVKNGTNIKYSLRADEKIASKEELIKMAKEVNAGK
ncbi:hypothetical protein ACFYU8_27975 [Brevibacillus sp. NPDC003359]|uniref:hypothetical protein n=1 Tax=unclassified Brevibacillus TaxID=2684853 RepID=UPI0036906A8A